MLAKQAFFALVLGTSLAAFSIPGHSQDNSGVVAIAGRKVTASELEEKEAAKLLQARYKYYVAERDAWSNTSTMSYWKCRRRKNQSALMNYSNVMFRLTCKTRRKISSVLL